MVFPGGGLSDGSFRGMLGSRLRLKSGALMNKCSVLCKGEAV
jgi:hypothetical protein